MFCRIAFHDRVPGSIDDPRAAEFRAWVRGQPGFVAGWHAQDPDSGRVVSFTVWDSEAHAAALRDKQPPGGPVGMKPVQLESFHHVMPF